LGKRSAIEGIRNDVSKSSGAEKKKPSRAYEKERGKAASGSSGRLLTLLALLGDDDLDHYSDYKSPLSIY
jgi:hypothetical protein